MVEINLYNTAFAKAKLPATVVANTIVNLVHVDDGVLTPVASFVRGATERGIYYTLLTIQPKRPAGGYVSPSLGFRKAVGKGNRYDSKWYSLFHALHDCGINFSAEDTFVTVLDAANVIKKCICE